ncbi:MAG TPA: ImmA/IrrE family metallo-endopeptidase [Herpetosiphonaceae bacterium]|nr:ImmA/IrrE family metallo-endopeptidase [Herpetosiphonaceae bacterium]
MQTADEPGAERPASKAFMRYIEEQAILLRQRAGAGALEPFEPRSLVSDAKLQLAYPKDVTELPPAVLTYLSDISPKAWSGMGKPLPNGELFVLLHPGMTPERESVTIMEEVAHVHFGHEPSELVAHPLGWEQRKYNKQAEQEAYWTAGAVLLPSKAVAFAVWRGETATDLAVAYSVSVELAEMRIKTLGLWPHYDPDPIPMRRAG